MPDYESAICLGHTNHYILRYSYQLHGSVMATNLPKHFEFADSTSKDLYRN